MTTPGKNRLLKLLLIIMLIQPVSQSYAMTGMAMPGMNGGHHSAMARGMATDTAMPVADACQNTHHALTEPTAAQTAPAVANATADNCCDTQACCPAFMVSGLTVQQDRPDSLPVTSVDSAMKRIDLPAEIRPPRQLSA
ncbi:MAG: hypothetical protein RRB22_15155 [Gammaproteobacteria bacterium]|nr:hypothetical protein [Gammaproteobacteria bacterium]